MNSENGKTICFAIFYTDQLHTDFRIKLTNHMELK